ncbi:unnamed protein product, partial [Acanthocheilonema viteae]
MSDPVAEFLAREQSVLAGIKDDSLGTSPPPYINSTNKNDAIGNGLLNDPFSQNSILEEKVEDGRKTTKNFVGLFREDFRHCQEENDTACVNEARLLSGTSGSGLDLPILANGVQRSSTTPSPSLAAMNNSSKPEPEKIKKWREEQKIMLEKK